jgi:CubicO group peptidase (beta-lactamase class C family)
LPFNRSIAWAQSLEKDLQAIASATLEKSVPAIWVAVARDGAEPTVACAGVRKLGAAEQVTASDKIHIGSCTKAFTAMLIARLVEQGVLKWDNTVNEVLPDLSKKIHQRYRSANLMQLLQHRAGMPRDAKNWWLSKGDTPTKIRANIALDSLREAPNHKPATQVSYSNMGYMVAGLMASQAAKSDWETLMRNQVFEPLKLTSAGFGPPSVNGNMDQPWGHSRRAANELTPLQADNAAALGPAGTIHITIQDWCRFANVFAGSAPHGFITQQSLDTLQAPLDSQPFACGWIVVDRDWAGGKALTHTGSNTMWTSTIWIAPAKKRIYIAAANCAGDDVASVLDQTIGELIQLDSNRN